MTKTIVAVLVASALWVPLAAHDEPSADSTGGSMVISVDIPARSGAPTPATPSPTLDPTPGSSPTPTSTSSPAPAAPESDADRPRTGPLAVTGGEVALWGGAFALLALAAGLAIRAFRRRSA